jgi:hypothetical protein
MGLWYVFFMGLVNYSAIDEKGRPVKGQEYVATKAELVELLQSEGLFLVSFSEAAETPQTGAQLEQVRQESKTFTSFSNLSKSQRFLIALIFISSITLGYFLARPRHKTFTPPDAFAVKLTQVKKGMTRKAIEEIFPLRDDGGKQLSSQTRYRADNGRIIEIAYDDRGGPWSPRNQKVDSKILIIDAQIVSTAGR